MSQPDEIVVEIKPDEVDEEFFDPDALGDEDIAEITDPPPALADEPAGDLPEDDSNA